MHNFVFRKNGKDICKLIVSSIITFYRCWSRKRIPVVLLPTLSCENKRKTKDKCMSVTSKQAISA